MASLSSKEYSVGSLGGSSFYVGVGDGKGGVRPRNTHLTYQKVDCWTGGSDFFLSQSR